MEFAGVLTSGLPGFFFTDREHFAIYNGVKSHNQFIKCGVPQG